MRLLQYSVEDEVSLTDDLAVDDTLPPYAILSHTWGPDGEEVTFQDLVNNNGKTKLGYEKIHFCGQQARRDGLQYFWIDTCCINKANKAELSHAIQSMFRWYRNASRCYVFLSDVSAAERKTKSEHFQFIWETAFRASRWFTRGWTLQELLAPSTVEFFSREQRRLGDKISLKTQIHEVTSIPHAVLEGAPLAGFSVNERLRWKEDRKTTREEDGAYSLIGILDVELAPIYGEGAAGAFRRLMDEIDKRERCIQDIRSTCTDPRDDKKRIEETKGGLLKDSYRWILDNASFQRWYSDPQSRLLWIKGDPGKGKTMLLCGIIGELQKSIAKTDLLSYFFCQASDARINSATAILRGLLYLLVSQQPSLVTHVRKRYDHGSKTMFEDTNAWIALTEIFADVLRDPSLNITYLIVDALDECITDLPRLLDFVIKQSPASSRVKWIVSSRNWPAIEEQLERAGHKVRLSLELNAESVSTAVRIFIEQKVLRLAQEKKYDEQTRCAVLKHLASNANDTFLWVALVCQNLGVTAKRNVLRKLSLFPPGLDSLYQRMMQQISTSDDAETCKHILASIALVYRPITLDELGALVEQVEELADDPESIREIVGLCGSFLSVREETVYFVHQSAKDFLLAEAAKEVFPSGTKVVHHTIFARSLKTMSKILRRDIYGLKEIGYAVDDVKQPYPDPLAAVRYSCVYWIDHLYDWNLNSLGNYRAVLQDGGVVDSFLRKKYLHWLEALSLCKSMSKGVVSMTKLKALIKGRTDASALVELVEDACRFIMSHKLTVENSPLQAYASALLFSPECSLVRSYSKEEEPKWITIKPVIGDKWSACLQTLEGHSGSVYSVAFSRDSDRVASSSPDRTIRIWDSNSGECLQTLEGHSGPVNSVAFSNNSAWLASASSDETVKIWDASSGEYLQTLNGHNGSVRSVAFSHGSALLTSASSDRTVKIWDARSGECLQTLESHSGQVNLVAFSHDSALLVSASSDRTVKIWDARSGECLQTLEGHSDSVRSVAFSHDSARVASSSPDRTVRIWNASSGECLQMLEGHSGSVNSVVFSRGLARLASASSDRTVKIWDLSSGECLQTLKGHSSSVRLVAFPHHGTRLASASKDKTIKIWDLGGVEYLQALECHSGLVRSVVFSHDSARLASASSDRTVKIWDASSGECLQTLEGHSSPVNSVAFSHDSARLASASSDRTVKIWDLSSGECFQTFEGHSFPVRSVAFSHDSARVASASDDNTVKIWDASSGECLQTLNTGTALYSISFDIIGPYLYTELGIIDTSAPSGSVTILTTSEPHNLQYQGLALSSDGVWIAYDSKNLVWLPSDYRPSCSAVSGRTISIGAGSGRVWICKFELDASQDLIASSSSAPTTAPVASPRRLARWSPPLDAPSWSSATHARWGPTASWPPR